MLKRIIHRSLFAVAAALFTLSAAAAGKVEVTGDTHHGTVQSSVQGAVVTLTVTPAEGYYIRKSDITATKTFMPTAGESRRVDASAGIPFSDELTLVGNDPDDLSLPRTYTVTLPGEEYDILLDVQYTKRQQITEQMVALSETVFVYNEQEQRPTVFVTGLTEGVDFTVNYAEASSVTTGTYTLTIQGRSTWKGSVVRTYKIFAGGKAEVVKDIKGGIIATSVDGLTVTLTVTPSDGYYIRKEDVVVEKTFMPVTSRRRAVAAENRLTIIGDDPDDLSLPRTYTVEIPGWEYDVLVDAAFQARKPLTSNMVTLSATSFIYNGNDQKPTITVRGLTEGVDYLVAFKGTSWSDVGTYSVDLTGRSTWKGTVTKTFTITKAPSVVTVVPEPQKLTHTGSIQTLIAAGDAIGGTMLYSLNGKDYATTLPTATAAGTYTVYYRVQGDSNHKDTEPKTVKVTIGRKDITVSGILAQDKVYDETTTATLTYDDVVFGGIVEGDQLTVTAKGTFADANAATDKTVSITELTLGGPSTANYKLANEGQQATTTATITKAPSSVTKAPQARTLTYTGQAQTLAEQGEAAGGVMQYSLDKEGDFSEAIPTATEATTYTLYYMVKGDANHFDTEIATIEVTIGLKTIENPIIELSENSFVYDGTAKKPTVTVKDGDTVISDAEYTVGYEDNINVGVAQVIITDVEGGNFTVNGQTTFTITKANAELTTAPEALTLIYSGTAQALVAAGNATGGILIYSTDGTDYAPTLPTATAAGTYTVYYRVQGDSNHNDTEANSISVTIQQKDITISGILAQDKVYDETTTATLTYDDVVFGGIVEGDQLTVTAKGTFADANAATDKTVSITELTLGGPSTANYKLANEGQQATTTATITKAPSSVTKAPQARTLTYTGQAQTLAEQGEAAGGVMQYSLDKEGDFSEAIPTATEAGTYTLYYMVKGDANHLDTEAESIQATIGKILLTVTANNKRMFCHEDMPTLTVSYDGFINNDSKYSLISEPVATTEATPESEAGTYDILVSGGEAVNYDFTYVSGTLTMLIPEFTDEEGKGVEAEIVTNKEGEANAVLTELPNSFWEGTGDIPTAVTDTQGNTYEVTQVDAEAFRHDCCVARGTLHH